MLKVTNMNTVARENTYTSTVEVRASNNPTPGSVSSSPAPAAATTESAAFRERVAQQVEELNRFVRARDAQIQFEIDDSSSRVVTKIVDINTREILRQIPSEEVLRIAEALTDSIGSSGKESLQLVQAKA